MRNHHGFTLIEVLIAAAILAVGLLALVGAFPVGYVDVTTSGGQSKATAYAQQKLEELKNLPFADLINPLVTPPNGNDTPLLSEGPPQVQDTAYTRTWNVCPVGPAPTACLAAGGETVTNPPNRVVRIRVTVNYTGGGRPQTATLDTMRAE